MAINVTQTEIQLEKFHVEIEHHLGEIDKMQLNDPEMVVEFAHDTAESMSLRLTDYVWSEKVGAEVIKYPASWWEAFKARFNGCTFPIWQWYLRKHPVKYEVHNIDFYATYPGYKPNISGRVCVGKVLHTRWERKA